MSDIKWEDPPRDRGANSIKWRNIVAALKQQPGRWALVAEAERTRNLAANLKRGVLGGTTRGELDATSMKNDDGTYRVYARYLNGTQDAK